MENFTQNATAHIILLEQSEQTTAQCKTQNGHSHIHNTMFATEVTFLRIDWRPRFVCDCDPTTKPLVTVILQLLKILHDSVHTIKNSHAYFLGIDGLQMWNTFSDKDTM